MTASFGESLLPVPGLETPPEPLPVDTVFLINRAATLGIAMVGAFTRSNVTTPDNHTGTAESLRWTRSATDSGIRSRMYGRLPFVGCFNRSTPGSSRNVIRIVSALTPQASASSAGVKCFSSTWGLFGPSERVRSPVLKKIRPGRQLRNFLDCSRRRIDSCVGGREVLRLVRDFIGVSILALGQSGD